MPEILRSALMPFAADYMYQVVNDVAAYPLFLPWCGGVTIHHADDSLMEASILMKKGKLDHWFRTRNNLQPGRLIEMTLIEGPFSQLQGCWRFTPIDEAASKIELSLIFEMDKSLTAMLIKPAFTRIANTMVESFCSRAKALHEQ